MSDSVVECGPDEQLVFGKHLIEFSNDMRTSCKSVKNHINAARDIIIPNETAKAMDELEELMDNILNLLPGIEEFGNRQITLIKKIRALP